MVTVYRHGNPLRPLPGLANTARQQSLTIESSNASHSPRAPANHPGLALDPVQVAGELDVPCLTDADQTFLRNFDQALKETKMTECPQCHISWFTIKLDRRRGICKECMKDNKSRGPNRQFPNRHLPALWSEANKLDPGEPPEHLEALGPLTPLEEWLIAR
ncbi:hypothetical protein E4U49_006751, partial [Claviceps purpurea]